MQTRFTLLAAGVAIGLFFGILLFVELGRWLGRRQVAKRGMEARTGVGVVEACFAVRSGANRGSMWQTGWIAGVSAPLTPSGWHMVRLTAR